MVAPVKGEVSLSYGDETYTMRLDFNALAEFEGEVGGRALDLLQEPDKLTITQVRALFWAGLRQCHPEITLPEAGRILTANQSSLGEALAATFPDAAPGNGGAGKSRQASKAS